MKMIQLYKKSQRAMFSIMEMDVWGCGQSKKSCYTGCVKAEDSSEKMNGFFYGTSDSSEHFIGCTDGCGGCIGTGGILGNTMEEIEQITGVD